MKTTGPMYSVSRVILLLCLLLVLTALHCRHFIEPILEMVCNSDIPDGTPRLVAHYPFDGNALDDSGNGCHGEVIGASSAVDRHGRERHALSFDGVDDYIDIINNKPLKIQLPVSFSFWVLFKSKTAILGTDVNDSLYYGVWVGINADLDRLNINFGDGGRIGPAGRRSKYIPAPEINEWMHIVGIIRDSTDMTIYVNGVDRGGEYGGTGGDLVYHAGHSNIGRMDSSVYGPPSYFHGLLDDLYLYDGALTEQDVKSLSEQ